MNVRVGVVVFPGSNCDAETLAALRLAGADAVPLWHEQTSLEGCTGVALPGGFAYGDYLRAGVIARFSPIMGAIASFAADGGLVLGICNGFQVLCEAGLLPGALLRNSGLRFVSREVAIVPERLDTPFTAALPERRPLRMPVAHGEGRYHADPATLDRLEAQGRILARYVDSTGRTAGPDDPANPNGSAHGIAGVIGEHGNVAGLMPHPERAVESWHASSDGLGLIRSFVDGAGSSTPSLVGAGVAAGG